MHTHDLDSKSLIRWFEAEKRDFPWRENSSPYAVWVSEIMLQQTQAAVVIPYFERWMERFPTIKSLAEASLDAVIKEWEGLGYYSRARNLHQGAQYVLQHHEGILPRTREELEKIKGLGEYTIGAILSFAFHQKAAAVDGNVLRVLSRYFLIEDDISKPKTVKAIRQLAQEQLPDNQPWVVAEALIELGATLCGRKPNCIQCPLRGSCAAFSKGMAAALPIKSKKVKVEELRRAVAVIIRGNEILLRRGTAGEIMQDLHEFPYWQHDDHSKDPQAVAHWIKKTFAIKARFHEVLPLESHGFTRYRVRLEPFLFHAEEGEAPEGYRWHPVDTLHTLAFSSGHRRIIENLNVCSLHKV
jgi:A/G-specific adenine glycosylase